MSDPAGAPTHTPSDRSALVAARTLRGFGSGALSVVLGLELGRGGYSPFQIGLALGLAMGAAALWAVLLPGRFGALPRRTLFLGGALAFASGGFLLWFDLANPWVLAAALVFGGVVAGGADVSPLGALEQGALANAVGDRERTRAFAVYNLAGYAGTAIGALVAGPLSGLSFAPPGFPVAPRDGALLLYGLLGLCLVPSYLRLSDLPERTGPPRAEPPLSPADRRILLRLSGLFGVDAFGGGLIANALVGYFLLIKFGASAGSIGTLLALANAAAGGSLLAAAPLARRFGLINTMVFTHLPSSGLLLLFAFTPTIFLAGIVWVARASISQMDVPTRQSYTQALVPRSQGAAAAGYTTAARSAQALGGPVAGALFSAGGSWISAPFALAGSVKIAYDVAVYRGFRSLRPPEEGGQAPATRVTRFPGKEPPRGAR